MKNILITGANGFIAKNLIAMLRRKEGVNLLLSYRENSDELPSMVLSADFIFHLAGINRPEDSNEFYTGNSDLTMKIVDLLLSQQRSTPIVLSSSTQVGRDNDYAKSKEAAEMALATYAEKSGANVFIYRLPNVFGKWSRPNYNTVIATWCSNMTRDISVQINDRSTLLQLVYIDDVVQDFVRHLDGFKTDELYYEVGTVYSKTLGEILDLMVVFKQSRKDLLVPNVGSGFERALYATYLSFLPTDRFSYALSGHKDERGTFYEILKTVSAGQFSLSTTAPGITRGNHYHDTKNEKFLVIKGKALIEYRQIDGEEVIRYEVSDATMEIAEMIPGYTHNITNIGDEEMLLLLWANEQFDREHPDTYFLKV